MNELVNLTNEVTMTSVEVVELINKFRLEEGNTTLKKHDVLLRDIRNEINTLNEFGIIGHNNFVESYYINSQNKKQPCYQLTKSGIMQILNKESAVVRYKTQQYIEVLENKLCQPQLPTTYKEALQQLLVQVEENEKLQIEVTQKQTIIDNVIDDKSLFAIGTVGKILKPYIKDMGAIKIFKFLRDNCILMDAEGTQRHNLPYDKYNKHFEMKCVESNFGTHTKTYFNGSGLKWFLNKLAKDGYLTSEQKEEIKSKF